MRHNLIHADDFEYTLATNDDGTAWACVADGEEFYKGHYSICVRDKTEIAFQEHYLGERIASNYTYDEKRNVMIYEADYTLSFDEVDYREEWMDDLNYPGYYFGTLLGSAIAGY